MPGVEPDTYRGFELAVHDPGIVLVTFNQPDRLNGMTQDMKRDLVETLVQAQMDDAVRVVVFTGSGRAFSAGDDISGRPRDSQGARALVPRVPPGHHDAMGTYNGLRMLSQSLNLAVRNLDKVTIAAINGVAVQTGFSLALSCDFRIASSEARLTSGTLRFALQPDEGGHYLLLQMIGLPKTLDFLLRNRMVSAAEALDLGLVHEVTRPEHLLDRALDLAREFAKRPAGRPAPPQARHLHRRRDQLHDRPRRHRHQDRHLGPPPRRPRRRPRLPGKAPASVQPRRVASRGFSRITRGLSADFVRFPPPPSGEVILRAKWPLSEQRPPSGEVILRARRPLSEWRPPRRILHGIAV